MTLHRAELSDNLIFQMIILSPLPDCLWCVLKPLAKSWPAAQQKSPAAHSSYGRMGAVQPVRGAPVVVTILDKP